MKKVDRALADIKEEYRSKVPSERTHKGIANNSRFNKKVDGFNECRELWLKVIKEAL